MRTAPPHHHIHAHVHLHIHNFPFYFHITIAGDSISHLYSHRFFWQLFSNFIRRLYIDSSVIRRWYWCCYCSLIWYLSILDSIRLGYCTFYSWFDTICSEVLIANFYPPTQQILMSFSLKNHRKFWSLFRKFWSFEVLYFTSFIAKSYSKNNLWNCNALYN